MGYGSDDRDDRAWRGRDERDERGGRRGYEGGNDRGFFERAGEEVRSWFGDDDGGRHRGHDGRRDHERGDPRSGGSGWNAGGWGNQPGNSWNRERPGERGWLGASERDEREGRFAQSGPDRSERQGRDYGTGANYGQGGDIHDPHYSQWRRRQIEELDRDYEDYRREHQSKFESEFGSWRTRRQGQRQMLASVAEDMEVLGADGSHLGTVDKVRGDRIILTRSDPNAGGIHHSIPCGWVERIEGGKVMLNRSAEQAQAEWRDEERGRALFERRDGRSEGPHILDRSFSGTYGRKTDD